MSKELISQNGKGAAPAPAPSENNTPINGVVFKPKKLEGFTDRLHDQPLKDNVYINKLAKGAKYIPVGIIEMKLDEMFFGLWSTENYRWQVIANEVVGSIDLKIFHPVAKAWITRTGAASVMIQQQKGAEITDISKKHKNTLIKDFPHLKSECLKNAAKSFGRVFGRDLNRDFIAEYAAFSEKVETLANEDVQNSIDQITNVDELNTWMKENRKLWKGNEPMIDFLLTKKKDLARGIYTK